MRSHPSVGPHNPAQGTSAPGSRITLRAPAPGSSLSRRPRLRSSVSFGRIEPAFERAGQLLERGHLHGCRLCSKPWHGRQAAPLSGPAAHRRRARIAAEDPPLPAPSHAAAAAAALATSEPHDSPPQAVLACVPSACTPPAWGRGSDPGGVPWDELPRGGGVPCGCLREQAAVWRVSALAHLRGWRWLDPGGVPWEGVPQRGRPMGLSARAGSCGA